MFSKQSLSKSNHVMVVLASFNNWKTHSQLWGSFLAITEVLLTHLSVY